MKSRYLLAGLTAATLMAISFPAAAAQVKGVVKSIDPQGVMFVIDPEEEGDSLLTFTVPEGVDFDDFIDGIEVGTDVLIEFDPDVCGDKPDCIDQATDIEEL